MSVGFLSWRRSSGTGAVDGTGVCFWRGGSLYFSDTLYCSRVARIDAQLSGSIGVSVVLHEFLCDCK